MRSLMHGCGKPVEKWPMHIPAVFSTPRAYWPVFLFPSLQNQCSQHLGYIDADLCVINRTAREFSTEIFSRPVGWFVQPLSGRDMGACRYDGDGRTRAHSSAPRRVSRTINRSCGKACGKVGGKAPPALYSRDFQHLAQETVQTWSSPLFSTT